MTPQQRLDKVSGREVGGKKKKKKNRHLPCFVSSTGTHISGYKWMDAWVDSQKPRHW